MKQFDAMIMNVLFIYLSLCARIEIQYNFVTLMSLWYDINLKSDQGPLVNQSY